MAASRQGATSIYHAKKSIISLANMMAERPGLVGSGLLPTALVTKCKVDGQIWKPACFDLVQIEVCKLFRSGISLSVVADVEGISR